MYHAGHPCEINAPWDVCLTFDNVARSLAEHGYYARLISKEEALDALERSYASNLVQIGENVREHPAFICNCCGCCCEALQAARKFRPMQPVATTNYIPEISLDKCVGLSLIHISGIENRKQAGPCRRFSHGRRNLFSKADQGI